MKRRDFIRGGLVTAGGILAGLPAFSGQPGKIVYDDTLFYPGRRQRYLDDHMAASGSQYPYVKGFSYNEDPVTLVLDKAYEASGKANRPMHVFVNEGKLRRTFSFALALGTEEFGLGKKTEVYVFPFAFSNLNEKELVFTLGHENFHCGDIFNGIEISGCNVDAKALDIDVVDPLMELRAYYSDMNRMATAFKAGDIVLIDDMREDYIDTVAANYVKYYTVLQSAMKDKDNGISDYSRDVIRDHLVDMSGLMKPGLRYTK